MNLYKEIILSDKFNLYEISRRKKDFKMIEDTCTVDKNTISKRGYDEENK